MIAALGMYDMPHARAANDRLWTAIRAALGEGPRTLDRDHDPWALWTSEDLLLAQTCGMPYRTRLHGHVQLVGTPDYGLPGCPPGHYNSVIVVREDDPARSVTDLEGRTIAYNEALSQSGWAAPAVHFAQAGVGIGTRVQTGAHAASAAEVADGGADFAGLDALTWAMLAVEDPALTKRLRVLATTAPTPALPFITAKHRAASAIFAAISTALATLNAADREILHLRGLLSIPSDAYLAVSSPDAP